MRLLHVTGAACCPACHCAPVWLLAVCHGEGIGGGGLSGRGNCISVGRSVYV